MPIIIAPMVTLSVFSIQAAVRGTGSLSTVQAFTSLALITLFTEPASQLMAAVTFGASALGCFGRIEKYLLASTHQDTRQLANMNMLLSENNTVQQSIELQPVSPRWIDDFNIAFQIDNASIRPSEDAEFVIKDISMKAKSGSLNIIAGPVGSGKSTILKAILGEIPCESGRIGIKSTKIAYCTQSPWLRNASIQQCICELTENQALDEAWYNTVLEACVLKQDLETLSEGDRTFVGSRGSKLSGGQKQRISLARALYARKELVLLDDVLSALDGKTEEMIVQRLFGADGLFRKLGTTVVLVTHASRYFCSNSFCLLSNTFQPDISTLRTRFFFLMQKEKLLNKVASQNWTQ